MIKTGKVVKISLVVLGVIVLFAGTIFGAIWVSHIESDKAAARYPKCTGRHAAHAVFIRDNKVEPENTDAQRCDTLTVTNLDNVPRIMAFGAHDRHVAYDGVTERYLTENGKFTVTLIQPGTFHFHDHEDDDVRGTFTVSDPSKR